MRMQGGVLYGCIYGHGAVTCESKVGFSTSAATQTHTCART